VLWRLTLAATAIVVLAVAGVLLATDKESEAPRLRTDIRSAETLVDSIGVNVHFSYVDTAYARRAEVLARLRELGVRHVRDGMPYPIEAMRAGLRAVSRQGIRGTLIGDPTLDPASQVADSVALMGDGIAGFEGPNELDASGNPAWPAMLRDYMPALDAAVGDEAPGVPVIGPSFIDPASRIRIPPDLPGLFNAHPYPQGGPPEPAIGDAVRELRARGGDSRAIFTESGYHNALRATTGQPPVSEEAAAVYLPRLLVTAFGAGVRRTFIYELLDEKPDPGLLDPEQHFGLLRQDLSPKPVFRAVQTLIAALKASTGKRRSGQVSLNIQVRGADDVERLVLARRDRSLVVALWRRVAVWDQDARRPVDPQPLPVELSFGTAVDDVVAWRPSIASQPVLRREHARRLSFELRGDLVLVSFR
jgi:hypothetical protein